MYNEAQKAIEDIVVDQPLEVSTESKEVGPTIKSNIFKSLLTSRHLSQKEKERDRITQEAFVVLVAGGETTARVITTASYHILANKGTVLLKLREELATLSGNVNSRLEVKVLEQLPYLVSRFTLCHGKNLTEVVDGSCQGVAAYHSTGNLSFTPGLSPGATSLQQVGSTNWGKFVPLSIKYPNES